MKAADKLRATWSKRGRDVALHFPLGFGTRCDAHWLSGVLGKEFTSELEDRGYDVTTLKFEVSPASGNPKFRSQRPETDEEQTR